MCSSDLITVREGVDMEEAKRLLHKHRIEKLLVVDEAFRCVGLVTVKDIEKAQQFPNACKDEKGRLRVAAATGVGKKGIERAEALLGEEVDLIVVELGQAFGVFENIGQANAKKSCIHGNHQRSRIFLPWSLRKIAIGLCNDLGDFSSKIHRRVGFVAT